MPLTPEQQNIIENSIWEVNTALKRQGLSANEDLRQSAILYMCQCLVRFQPSKDVKWTTYAYKNIYLYIRRKNKSQYRHQDLICKEDISKYAEIIPDEDIDYYSRHKIDKIKDICTDLERRILELKQIGYSNKQIGELTNLSISNINTCFKRIRNKAEEIDW